MSFPVSLIVPVYNAGEYLKEFLDSVKAQTFTEFETVLVDDGSTDGSAEVLDEYKKGDNRVKVIHKKNGGVVSAWKLGVKESCGELLAFADPDDIMHPEMLETQYRLLTDNAVDMVITGFNELIGGSVRNRRSNHWGLSDGLYEGEELEKIKRGLFGDEKHKRQAFRMFRWNKMFKRALIIDNLDYTADEVTYGDDICFFAAAVYDSSRIYYQNTRLYTYRVRDDSITTRAFSQKEVDNSARVLKAIERLAADKGYMSEQILFGYPAFLIRRLLRKICRSGADKKQKKAELAVLSRQPLVKEFSVRKAKKYTPFETRTTIRFLKLKLYSPLIRHYKK